MAKPPETVRMVLDGSAVEMAFRIASLFERALVARAIDLAVPEVHGVNEVVVTADHVRRAIHPSVLSDACAQAGVGFDGKAAKSRSRATAG